ncbi:glycoside hydrolase family 92 protein [Scleroderma citrinum]
MSTRSLLSLTLLMCLVTSAASKRVPDSFSVPLSDAVDHVNPLIGNGGYSPNGSGGMIPSTAPPFAMTRWVAQTQENYVSVTPYNYTATSIHGFQGTHQPAIWMGESGQVVVCPGAGDVRPKFEDRGMRLSHEDEVVSASYYSVEMDAIEGGRIVAQQSATSRVGHLRFTFFGTSVPYVLVEATRASVIRYSDPNNFTYPQGAVAIDPESKEICGRNPERQDFIIGPVSTPAKHWSGYFCARFDQPFASWGVAQNGSLSEGSTNGSGAMLSGYARFGPDIRQVDVRVGVSFISIEQARRNLDIEIPDGQCLEETSKATRTAWAEKLDRIKIEGATKDQKDVFYTGFFHTLQYPYEQDEYGRYYSGYDDTVHDGVSYTGYSIWDTYRAEWAWLLLFAPERIPGMIQSMLQDYNEGGWLPMWKNIIETNIMIGTHADSLIAEAVLKGISGFDLETAWEAVHKDAVHPPVNDSTTVYDDREENVDYEVRAGLSSVYTQRGWVAADVHSEAASRTLAYAYDDYAVSVLAGLLRKTEEAFFRNRSLTSPFTIFNLQTGFMEARNASGAWAGSDVGWTEGDDWAYTFDVVHDIPGLIERRGGNASFVAFLDEHFDGESASLVRIFAGHNDHSNEPSHHIPYLYALAGAASKTQARVRQIATDNYNATVDGLSGNEDCGQMSAWYLFSALGFYPVNPVSGEYIIGRHVHVFLSSMCDKFSSLGTNSPFFDSITLELPGLSTGLEGTPASTKLRIFAPGAPSQPYVRSLTVHGRNVDSPIITHADIVRGGHIEFEMSVEPQPWASGTLATGVNRSDEFHPEVQAQYHIEL